MNLELYLPFYNISLLSNKTDLPSRKSIKIYEDKVHIIGHLDIDERSNTIKNVGFEHPIVSEIINKFIELKKSDVGYGNIGDGGEYEYDGVKYLRIEDFFDYLKIKNREQIINNLKTK